MRSWERDKREPDQLREKPVAESWLNQVDRFAWEGSQKLCGLDSYKRLEQVVSSDEMLSRRIYATYGVVAERMHEPDSTSLCIFIQNNFLSPLIYDSRSFEFNEALLADRYGEVEAAFNKPVINCEYIFALRNVRIDGDIELNSTSSLRRLSDSELDTGIAFGSIETHIWGRGRATLGVENQNAISSHKRLVVDGSLLSKVEFKHIVSKMVNAPSPPLELGDKVCSALNLYADDGAAEIGGVWAKITLGLTEINTRIDTNYSPTRRRGYRKCVVMEKDADNFKELFDEISKKTTWSRLQVALMRFSSGIRRISEEEAIVDLAIAAESIFGSPQPGETTYQISLNAAVFLATPEWPASAVRSFFKDVYSRRSAIVHGTNRTKGGGKQQTATDMREQLEAVMRNALTQAVSQLSTDSNALNWDKRLEILLHQFLPLQAPSPDVP